MIRVVLPLAAAFALLAAAAEPAAKPLVRNGKIAFVSAGDIWVVNPDGSGLANLTRSAARDSYPTWSPEGTRIVFSSNRAGSRDLWIMNADGTEPRRVTGDRADRSVDSAPSVSPDGRRLVFARRVRGNQEIYVVNLDGSGLHRLTRFPGIDFEPAWSPDGSEIVFWRALRPGGRTVRHLFAMRTDGSELRRLTWGSSSDAPAWSPDGRRIAFTRGARGRGDLWVMRADGTGLQRVTSGPPHDDDPAWSPDGSMIAFTSDRIEATSNLFALTMRTPRRLVRVTRFSGDGERSGPITPTWQPVP